MAAAQAQQQQQPPPQQASSPTARPAESTAAVVQSHEPAVQTGQHSAPAPAAAPSLTTPHQQQPPPPPPQQQQQQAAGAFVFRCSLGTDCQHPQAGQGRALQLHQGLACPAQCKARLCCMDCVEAHLNGAPLATQQPLADPDHTCRNRVGAKAALDVLQQLKKQRQAAAAAAAAAASAAAASVAPRAVVQNSAALKQTVVKQAVRQRVVAKGSAAQAAVCAGEQATVPQQERGLQRLASPEGPLHEPPDACLTEGLPANLGMGFRVQGFELVRFLRVVPADRLLLGGGRLLPHG